MVMKVLIIRLMRIWMNRKGTGRKVKAGNRRLKEKNNRYKNARMVSCENGVRLKSDTILSPFSKTKGGKS